MSENAESFWGNVKKKVDRIIMRKGRTISLENITIGQLDDKRKKVGFVLSDTRINSAGKLEGDIDQEVVS